MVPGQVECARQEFKISRDTFADRMRFISPQLDDEAVGVLQAEFEAEAAARGE
jgi:hypothetical protein